MTLPMPPAMALSAVIPAAGFSSRMHQYKPLLKLGGKPMIEVVIRLFQRCGILDIIVVTGHNQDLLNPIVQKVGARSVFNPDFKTGMLGSIQKGAGQISSKSRGFFLLPVDIPAIRPVTIQTLILSFEKSGENIIIPEFCHTPGHPPLIPARLIPKIVSMGSDSNLGKLLLSQDNRLVRHPVHDRGILLDADTREDYEILAQKYQQMNIPDKAECQSIIQWVLPGEIALQSHLTRVAETALKLGHAVERGEGGIDKTYKKSRLNLDLIQAAALLHDIKRKEKNHAQAGSRLLKALGFPQVADIVAEHMTIQPGNLITEKEIVYLADKLCHGNRVEPDYTKRFKEKIKQAPDAEIRIFRRYKAAKQIQACIEAATGQSIRTILQNTP
ncbi:MAG: NTP transferase domain-containing protein [Proteobacteria bacterium]|nr:NTP transferase domain-containing protein [Pseudomonadota bacterium]MBU1583852.1 NTP transferase domain-containing protein [Pseudomonadota bacterium]MBU2453303.1 NTP transferase domain-containing protein [Pseudomonadota bacterium]MBU2630178.1 NTP transferase domain-containing protein [Pseudomonadota bacterium]